jgi:hypothetical protein
VIFEPDSRLRKVCGFQNCRSFHRIEIPASVEHCQPPLADGVVFVPGSRLAWMGGFEESVRLKWIVMPASVEVIEFAFDRCESLKFVTFEAGTRLRVIDGFRSCGSLRRIVIPASVQKIEILIATAKRSRGVHIPSRSFPSSRSSPPIALLLSSNLKSINPPTLLRFVPTLKFSSPPIQTALPLRRALEFC